MIPQKEFNRINKLSLEKFKKFKIIADMCRLNTFIAVKKAGSGHLGSSFSAMDIATYLYYEKLSLNNLGSPDRDIYFSSKGHDVPAQYSILYSLGILSKEKLLKLRRLNGLDGHPEINIKGIEASSGSLGMGISKGKGMAWAKKYNNKDGHVYVLLGDGELQEGQIYEALQTTMQQKISNLTVIVDHNKYQTDKKVDDIISLRNLKAKIKTYGWYVDQFNGHDFNAIDNAISKSREETTLPKFLIADTIKGKGISFMEPSADSNIYEWHSGAPDDNAYIDGFNELTDKINKMCIDNGLPEVILEDTPSDIGVKSTVSKEYIADAYGEELVNLASTRKDIVVLDGDLSADCRIRNFEIKYSDRFIENGIAEQDMVSMAGGLASQGLIPVVNSFASFLAARANEQIYNNSTEKNKIIYACHFAGIIPAGPGKSHQSIRDISLFSSLSNCTIFQPSNGKEAKLIMKYFTEDSSTVSMIRMNIGPSPQIINLPSDYEFSEGVGSVIQDGEKICIITYGPVMLNEALIASKLLRFKNVEVKIINMPWLNKINKNWFKSNLDNCDHIIIIDDHHITGGLGDFIISELHSEKNYNFTKFGITSLPNCGNPIEVLNSHSLDGKSIAKNIAELIGLDDIDFDSAESLEYFDNAPQ